MKTILMLKLHLIEYKKAHRGHSRLGLDIYMVHVLTYIPFVVFEYLDTTLDTWIQQKMKFLAFHGFSYSAGQKAQVLS